MGDRSPWEGAPTPPESVRAIMADGREIPLEVVYVGWDGETHHWRAIFTLPERPATVKVRTLPAKTSVALQFADG